MSPYVLTYIVEAAGLAVVLFCLFVLVSCAPHQPPSLPQSYAPASSPSDAIIAEMRWLQRQNELEERRKWREENLWDRDD